jgi:hypothetical protein
LSNKAAHEIGGLFLAREFSAELKKPNLTRRIALEACKASDDGLLPAGNLRSKFR